MIRVLSIVLLSMVVFVCASPGAHCAQTLTFTLEEPGLGSKNNTTSASKISSNTESKSQSAAQQPKQDTVRLGRVGLVQVSTAYIYKSRSQDSSRYATVDTDTPLAITKEEGDWYGVLMSNSTTGWIPKKNVRMIDYEVVAPKTEASRSSYTSRGGGRGERMSLSDHPIIRSALNYWGVRYVWGGTDPDSGMDCSAFVRSVFKDNGISLPRTAREQAQVGTSIPYDQLQPGDRLYFACHHSYVDHCGIYAGNGYFVHCASAKKGVCVDSLSTSFFWNSLVTARRS